MVTTFGHFRLSVMISKYSFPLIRPISFQDSVFVYEHKSIGIRKFI